MTDDELLEKMKSMGFTPAQAGPNPDHVALDKLREVGVPIDTIEHAKAVGLTSQELLQLVIEHTLTAAEAWLRKWRSRHPKK